MGSVNSSHSVMSALGRARQRLADILTPDPSPDFDREIGRLLGQLDDAAIIAAVRQHADDASAARLEEKLRSLRGGKGVTAASRESGGGWVVRLRFEPGNLTAEREFMPEELAEIEQWIDRTVARAEASSV
ncbi:MAG: hypothetical protein AB7S41_08050 [Parvibaculaceae bacterium]